MELPHLRTFLAVYRNRNLTAAARQLHLSQPAVSAQLRALEASLGRPLFVRLPRGVAPTPVADSLAREIAAPLDALHAIATGFAPHTAPFDATCYLGGPADALATLVLPALVPLTEQGLRLRVRTGVSEPLVEAVAAGELDVVVATTPHQPATVTLTRLVEERLLLVAAPVLAARVTPAPAGMAALLAELPLLGYAEHSPLIRRYFRQVFPGAQPPAPRVVVDDLRALLALAARGAGWTVLPDYLARPALSAGELRLLHQPQPEPANTLFTAVRTARREHPATRAVLELLHASVPAAAAAR